MLSRFNWSPSIGYPYLGQVSTLSCYTMHERVSLIGKIITYTTYLNDNHHATQIMKWLLWPAEMLRN